MPHRPEDLVADAMYLPDLPEHRAEEIISLAVSVFGPEAPEAIAYSGMDAWMEGNVVQVRTYANAFMRIRN